MKKKDFNKIAKIEKAIAKKYGAEAIQTPQSRWDDQKEQNYLEQLKQLAQKDLEFFDNERKVKEDGFLITEKLLNREGVFTTCPVCKKASRTAKDDVYINKFECCFVCYVKWVEDREDRWKKGWRPNGNST